MTPAPLLIPTKPPILVTPAVFTTLLLLLLIVPLLLPTNPPTLEPVVVKLFSATLARLFKVPEFEPTNPPMLLVKDPVVWVKAPKPQRLVPLQIP